MHIQSCHIQQISTPAAYLFELLRHTKSRQVIKEEAMRRAEDRRTAILDQQEAWTFFGSKKVEIKIVVAVGF